MDGTVLNSIAAAERVWGAWALRHGLDPVTFLPTMHGKRGIDTISQLGLPGVDPAREAAGILQGEIDDVEGVVPIAGAVEFLLSLPADRWAIVTSSPIELAKRRIAAAGIPQPRIMVTAEDVTAGKPDPQGYLLGARKLGFSAADCLVFEDVPAGILAGEAAGADVMVVTATHTHAVDTAHATITAYEEIKALVGQGSLSLARTRE
nr:HAD-IA family hydrolase [Rhizobium sp. BK251]